VHTLLRNKGEENKTDALLMQMRTYADQESVFQYLPVAGVAAQMLVSKYKTEDILPEMRKIGELARDDETLKLVGDITAQVHQRGYITKMDLTRMQKDAKVPIYEYLLKAMGQEDTLPNEIALFKRLRTPAKNPVSAEYFEKAESMMAAGPFKGHQIEQLMTFQGQFNSVLDRTKDVMEGVGTTWNKFVYPLMRLVNQIKPAQILGFFSQAVPKAAQLGEAIKTAFTELGNTGRLQEAGTTLGDIFSKIGTELNRVFGVSGSTLVQKITSAFDRLNDALHWVNTHFHGIALWTKRVIETFLALKAAQIALIPVTFVSALANVASALVGIRGAAFGAAAGMKGLAAAEGTANAAGLGLAGTLGGIVAVVAGSAWLAHFIEGESRKHAPEIIKEQQERGAKGGTVGGQYNPSNFPYSPALKALEDAKKSADQTKTDFEKTEKSASSIQSAFEKILSLANQAAGMPGGLGGNYGLHGALGSNQIQTEYGPGVAGDQPGGPTYDSESYHGRGHIGGQAFDLNSPGPQPTAMKSEWAKYHYGVEPGGTYRSDLDNQMHRYMDTTGARNPKNEDFYKGKVGKPTSSINIHYSPTIHHNGDEARLSTTLKGHSEHLSAMLRKAIQEDSRLSYA
jgi:hypothetical protein